MKTSKFNVFATIVAVLYFVFLSLPLLKGLFASKNKPSYYNRTEWIEEPMMIES